MLSDSLHLLEHFEGLEVLNATLYFLSITFQRVNNLPHTAQFKIHLTIENLKEEQLFLSFISVLYIKKKVCPLSF